METNTVIDAAMSTVGPDATTVQLAAAVPVEETQEPAVAVDIPETPAAELNQEVKIDPLPAFDRALNPFKLAPGEPVPKFGAEELNSHVTLDQESYEKGAMVPGIDDLPTITNNLIPESSLPIVEASDAIINTVSADSTTTILAGQVPLEPQLPVVAKEGEAEVEGDTKAAAVLEQVSEESRVEPELPQDAPQDPPVLEDPASMDAEKSEVESLEPAAVAAAVAGIDVTGTDVFTGDTVTSEAIDSADLSPASGPEIAAISSQADSIQANVEEVAAPVIPDQVPETIKETGEAPEAAVHVAAVEDANAAEPQPLPEVLPATVTSETQAESQDASTVTTLNANGTSVATEAAVVASKPENDAPLPSRSKAPESPAGT
jgi:hypothetical protein